MRSLTAYPCFSCVVHLGSGGVAAASAVVGSAGESAVFCSPSPLPWCTVRSSMIGAVAGVLQALRTRTRNMPSDWLASDTCAPLSIRLRRIASSTTTRKLQKERIHYSLEDRDQHHSSRGPLRASTVVLAPSVVSPLQYASLRGSHGLHAASLP